MNILSEWRLKLGTKLPYLRECIQSLRQKVGVNKDTRPLNGVLWVVEPSYGKNTAQISYRCNKYDVDLYLWVMFAGGPGHHLAQ